MADTSSPKKRAVKSAKKTVAAKSKAGKPEKTEISEKQTADLHGLEKTRKQLETLGKKLSEATDKGMHDTLDTTRQQLGKLGEKLHEAADRGIHLVKDLAEEVHRFATDATEMTKIKIEIHNLKKERDSILMVMGQRLKNMYHARKLTNVRSKFKSDMSRLDEIESDIAGKEKEAKKLSLDIRKIR
jgi:hypothetical protein